MSRKTEEQMQTELVHEFAAVMEEFRKTPEVGNITFDPPLTSVADLTSSLKIILKAHNDALGADKDNATTTWGPCVATLRIDVETEEEFREQIKLAEKDGYEIDFVDMSSCVVSPRSSPKVVRYRAILRKQNAIII